MKRSKITRVETWINLGVPDCLVGIKGRLVLVELKVATKTGKIKFSPHQISFHKKHEDLACFIFVSSFDLKSMNVYKSKRILELSDHGLNSIPELKGVLNGSSFEDYLIKVTDSF